MIRIVGDDPQAVKRCTCRNCAAIVEYTPNETKTEVHRDYGGGSDTFTFIQCPRCNNKINVR